MSNVVAFNPGQVPAFARAGANSDLMKSLSGGGAAGKRISIKGGVFRLYDAGKEIAKIDDRYLDVVVCSAAAHISRTYYSGKYKEDESSAPSCWSVDGTVPDPAVVSPQASACADCPQNIKGSGEGDTRSCRYNQRLAVVLANDISGSVMQLQLPAQSIFGKGDGDARPLQAYARFLATQKISPDMVVTRLKFDTDSATPKLFFSAQRWLTEQEYEKVQEQGKSDDAVQAITMSVFQTDTGKAPSEVPQIAGKPLKAKTEPKEEAEVVDAPAPTKREKPVSTPPVGNKAALDQLVSAWAGTDDDEA